MFIYFIYIYGMFNIYFYQFILIYGMFNVFLYMVVYFYIWYVKLLEN